MTAKPKLMSRAECADRLRKVQVAYVAPPTYVVGDILIMNPLMIPDGTTEGAMQRGIFMPMIVLAIAPSQEDIPVSDRDNTNWPGQWVRVAEIDRDGSIAMQWAPSWMYVQAPTSMIDDTTGTSH